MGPRTTVQGSSPRLTVAASEAHHAAFEAHLGRELGVAADNLHKFVYEWTSSPFTARCTDFKANSGPPPRTVDPSLRTGPISTTAPLLAVPRRLPRSALLPRLEALLPKLPLDRRCCRLT